MNRVYLVGAGPGNPLLVTVRGRRLLGRADVVVYDHLVSQAALAFAHPGCELVSVGKRGYDVHLDQAQVNDLLVELAGRGEGETIVRLKGGDPCVFGRGGEEMEALDEAGVVYEVVPGVTSAQAAGAYAGIPLTQRGIASSLRLVTGNEDPTKQDGSIDWDNVAGETGTLCLYMALRRLPELVAKLRSCGMAPDLPVVVVERASLGCQRVCVGTLATIARRVAAERIEAPALFIAGEVVRRRTASSWFDRLPLAGRRVLVTRAADQNGSFVEGLLERGAEVEVCPVLEMHELEPHGNQRDVSERLGDFSWIAFTSARAVAFFFERLFARGLDARACAHAHVAAIGKTTSQALRDHGIVADVVPARYHSRALAEALLDAGVGRGDAVLLPRARDASDDLPRLLEEAGARCETLALYETRLPRPSAPSHAACERLAAGQVDAVTFTSPSSVRLLGQLMNRELPEVGDAPVARCAAFSIGPATTRALRARGIEPAAEAHEHTVDGLLHALEAYYGTRRRA